MHNLSQSDFQVGSASMAIIIFFGVLVLLMWPYNRPAKNPNASLTDSTSTTTTSSGTVGGMTCYKLSDPTILKIRRPLGDFKSDNEEFEIGAEGDLSRVRANVLVDDQFFLKKKHTKLYVKADLIEGAYYDSYFGGAGDLKVMSVDKNGRPKEIQHNFSKYIPMSMFMVHLDLDNKPVSVTVKEGSTSRVFYLTDIYQDSAKTEMPDVLFSCDEATRGKNVTALGPNQAPVTSSARLNLDLNVPQNKSPDHKQLQLEYFLFTQQAITVGNSIAFTPGCKPAIYLYPSEKTAVNVKVKTRGILTYTDPKYPDSGWEVIAEPDGKLSANSLQPTAYNYLYYESKVPDELVKQPTEGLVVSFEKLGETFGVLLPQLGLDKEQVDDFTNYWLKALKYSPYYFVGVMSLENIEQMEPLEITPKPDLINRVRIYFKALDKKPNGNNFQLPATSYQPASYNFKVVEWGGMVKSDILHPFTCSQ